MKIVDLCEFYSERGGGVRSYLEKLCQAASNTPHQVVVVAPGPKDEVRTEGQGTLVRFKAPPMPYDPTYHVPWRLDRMRSLVRELRPDVLQVSSPFSPAWVARTLRVPLKTYVYHSDPIGCYVTRLGEAPIASSFRTPLHRVSFGYMRRICNAFDATIVAGTWLENLLAEQGIHNAHAIPFGIDKRWFGPEHRDPTLRRKLLGCYADDPTASLVLVGGRLAMDKRQSLVMQALIELSKQRSLAVVLLGDGPERETLEALGRSLRAFTAIRFTHDRGEYRRLLASVDCVAHGSMCETFGFFLAESLASGTPLVVPDQGGALHMGNDGCREVYPAFGGPARLANAVGRLLDRPREALRESARQEAAHFIESSEHFQRLFAFYEQALRKP